MYKSQHCVRAPGWAVISCDLHHWTFFSNSVSISPPFSNRLFVLHFVQQFLKTPSLNRRATSTCSTGSISHHPPLASSAGGGGGKNKKQRYSRNRYALASSSACSMRQANKRENLAKNTNQRYVPCKCTFCFIDFNWGKWTKVMEKKLIHSNSHNYQ